MSIMKFLTGAVVALGLSVGASSAATVFNLGGSGGTIASYTDTVDGIGLTVTGERRDGLCGFLCSFFQPENLHQAAGGLGVNGGPLDANELDGQIDERMTFSFDQTVKLLSVTFNGIDGNDFYNVLVDFSTVATGSLNNPFFFAVNTVGNSVRIDVTANGSAFRVSSITVAAIPLPAGGLLLLGALGGLAVLRRRRT